MDREGEGRRKRRKEEKLKEKERSTEKSVTFSWHENLWRFKKEDIWKLGRKKD